MGFLSCNRPRPTDPGHWRRKKRQKLSHEPVAPPPVHLPMTLPRTLEGLPSELLAAIFIYSSNLSLPQVSMDVAKRLGRSRYLERQLVAAALNEKRELPVRVLTWAFVTKDLLESLEIERFDQRYLPASLSDGRSPRATELTVYAVRKGCRVEDAPEFYARMLEQDRLDMVEVLLERRAPSDHRAIIMAMDRGLPDLADRLLGVNSGLVGADQIWERAHEIDNKSMLDRLGPHILDLLREPSAPR